MRRQMQKSCNEDSPPNTPKSKQNDDVDIDQVSFENLRSFYRGLCEEEMAKISRNASFQSESRADRLSAGSASSGGAAADGASSSADSTIPTAAEIGASERELVVIVTYSRSPLEDFRRSMEEIVAARVERGGEVDREFMEELLFRYLELNNDKFSRDILRAFLELIGVSHEDSGRAVLRRRRWRWNGGFSKKRLKLQIKNMQKLCSKYRWR